MINRAIKTYSFHSHELQLHINAVLSSSVAHLIAELPHFFSFFFRIFELTSLQHFFPTQSFYNCSRFQCIIWIFLSFLLIHDIVPTSKLLEVLSNIQVRNFTVTIRMEQIFYRKNTEELIY